MRRATVRVGVAAWLVLALGAGCGKVAEKAVEKGTEKAIEDQTGGTADFDLSDGKVKVSDGKGGTYEVDGSGKVTGKDGQTQVQTGDDARVPAGWPKGLVPAGITEVLSATSSTTPGREYLSMTVRLQTSTAEAGRAFRAQLARAGYRITNDQSDRAEGAQVVNVVASDGTNDVVASIGTDTVATVAILEVYPTE